MADVTKEQKNKKEPKIKKEPKLTKEPKERKRLTPSLAPITKKDIEKLGATENCKGCDYLLGKQPKRTPHCLPCKFRFQCLFVGKGYEKRKKSKGENGRIFKSERN